MWRAGRAPLGDRVGDAAVLEHLHRPLAEHVGLRQVRRSRLRADEEWSTPWRASNIDAVSPAPPPPTTNTGTCSLRIAAPPFPTL
jgi:hypothetical protein